MLGRTLLPLSPPYNFLRLFKFRGGEELIFRPHPARGQKYKKMAIAGPPQLTKGPHFHYVSLLIAYLQGPIKIANYSVFP